MTRSEPDRRPTGAPHRPAASATLRAGLTPVLALTGTIVAAATARAGSDGAGPAGTSDVKAYCANIAAAASDARVAWQTGKLNELEARIRGRIAELEAKTAELRAWVAKRDDMEKRAADKLVGIYAKMRPETAATQISTLDDDMAAAVLAGLNPRQASAIFNEFVPERAAKLAGLIAGGPSADKAEPGKKL